MGTFATTREAVEPHNTCAQPAQRPQIIFQMWDSAQPIKLDRCSGRVCAVPRTRAHATPNRHSESHYHIMQAHSELETNSRRLTMLKMPFLYANTRKYSHNTTTHHPKSKFFPGLYCSTTRTLSGGMASENQPSSLEAPPSWKTCGDRSQIVLASLQPLRETGSVLF